MPLPRLLTLIFGLAVILGLMLWLVNSLYSLYIQIAFSTPLLANLLLILLIGLLTVLLAALIYYLLLFRRGQSPRRRRRRHLPPRLPEEKTEVAEETLRAVRRQVAQIQDEVTRRALLERSRDLEDSFSRGGIVCCCVWDRLSG